MFVSRLFTARLFSADLLAERFQLARSQRSLQCGVDPLFVPQRAQNLDNPPRHSQIQDSDAGTTGDAVDDVERVAELGAGGEGEGGG